MHRFRSHPWLLDMLWLLFWGAGSSIWCVSAAHEVGPTFDEPFYLQRGLEYWHTGSRANALNRGTMPLPVDLTTLPLHLWERWQGIPLDADADLVRCLPWARAMNLVFWWLLLIYGWRAGRHIAGNWGGRSAVALLACEPSLMAHASLATTDIAVSACLLALLFHFRIGRGFESPRSWLWRVGLPGFWFGMAFLAKASGPVFGLLGMMAVEWERLVRDGSLSLASLPAAGAPIAWRHRMLAWIGQAWRQWGPWRKDVFRIVALGLSIAFLYCGTDWRPHPEVVDWAHHLPEGPMATGMTWLAEHLCIFPNAAEGFLNQVSHNNRGHGVYILGVTAPHALWYYFPVTLLIKLSLPLLVLVGVMGIFRPRCFWNWACCAAAGLLIFSLTCRVQIGIRLILPLVVLAIVGVAAAAVTACRQASPGWKRYLLAGGMGCLLAWTTRAACAVWPHGLCYTNELWGGTNQGYLCLTDSNYDWGQGLTELAAWQRKNNISSLHVWYFGTDPAISSLPLREIPLHKLPPADPRQWLAQMRGQYLAVSTTYLYGPYGEGLGAGVAPLLRSLPPAARTQTFLIYDFTQQHGSSLRGQAVDKAP